MENKYYTPVEEEFHKGFKYEIRTIEYPLKKMLTRESFIEWKETFPDKLKWHPLVFDGLPINIVDYVGLSPFPWRHSTRVKCLDREDIEELEFEYDTSNKTHLYFYKNNPLDENYWFLSLEKETLIIEIFDSNEESSNSFFGKIKNKSELKRLLKQQLGI